MKQPVVSILMPAFNAEKYISEAIESVLNQTHTNWELLVLNDGSTDKTASVIASFSDPRIVSYTESGNTGYLESCNKLFGLASGDFVTFLDADDTCPPTRLEACLTQFYSNQELDFLTTDFSRCNAQNLVVYKHESRIDFLKYSSDPYYSPVICCATIFVRINLLKKVGGYHNFFKEIGGEDYHWLFMLSRAGKGSHLNENLYFYRTHSYQTHHVNENALKYFASDIIQDIRTAVTAGLINPLDNENQLKSKWLTQVHSNESELTYRKASSMLNRNQFKKALSHCISGFLNKPFSFTSWQRFSYLSYSIIIRWTR